MSEPAPPPSPAGAVPTCYRHPGREAYIRCQRCGKVICPDCMRDSAVGFQCPDCVKEGARSTRSGRTAYGGLRPSNAGITSMVIIGLNVLVWLPMVVPPARPRAAGCTPTLALLPTSQCLSESHVGRAVPAPEREPVQIGTRIPGDGIWRDRRRRRGVLAGRSPAPSPHVEFWHIGFNMLALWVLGPQLELAIGRVRFIALYLVSALAGSALVLWAAPTDTSTLGASGAVFGLMGALLVLAYKVRGNVQQILMWIGINAVLTLTISGISWQGHLGGFLGGLATGAVLVYAPRKNRTRLQIAGVSMIAIVVLAAIAARIVALA